MAPNWSTAVVGIQRPRALVVRSALAEQVAVAHGAAGDDLMAAPRLVGADSAVGFSRSAKVGHCKNVAWRKKRTASWLQAGRRTPRFNRYEGRRKNSALDALDGSRQLRRAVE